MGLVAVMVVMVVALVRDASEKEGRGRVSL